MGKDQRSFPRSPVELTVDIQVGAQWVEGRIVDLSVEGISLELRQSLEAGRRSRSNWRMLHG